MLFWFRIFFIILFLCCFFLLLFSDKEYMTKLVEAERARLELDSSIETATYVRSHLNANSLLFRRTSIREYFFYVKVSPKQRF